MSICTARACPGSGSHSEYGKLVPTMSSVSQPCIMSSDGFVPSRPIEPVTYGTSSGTVARPFSALAIPAPSASATASTSSVAPFAPRPTSMATFSPAFSTSAARRRSASFGMTIGGLQPGLECTAPCSRGGSS
jgi:hypothetical protein